MTSKWGCHGHIGSRSSIRPSTRVRDALATYPVSSSSSNSPPRSCDHLRADRTGSPVHGETARSSSGTGNAYGCGLRRHRNKTSSSRPRCTTPSGRIPSDFQHSTSASSSATAATTSCAVQSDMRPRSWTASRPASRKSRQLPAPSSHQAKNAARNAGSGDCPGGFALPLPPPIGGVQTRNGGDRVCTRYRGLHNVGSHDRGLSPDNPRGWDRDVKAAGALRARSSPVEDRLPPVRVVSTSAKPARHRLAEVRHVGRTAAARRRAQWPVRRRTPRR
jgi:hypothetical protein